jgi:uncharacterized protein (TIGR00255 family)
MRSAVMRTSPTADRANARHVAVIFLAPTWYKLRVRSMTGYGRGAAERDGVRVEVELRSVNHRFLDLKVRTGGLDAAIEDRVGSVIRARLGRGSVTASVRSRGRTDALGITVDTEVGQRVYGELKRLAHALGDNSTISLQLVCAQPGVLTPAEPAAGDESVAACASEATEAAVDQLVAMREAEGEALSRDAAARIDRIGELVETIAALAAGAPAEAARRLEERIERLLQSSRVQVDEARLAQEVAFLADRLDVTEELVRARSHLDQLRQHLGAELGPVGRKLDFLVQELGREVNTVASKSQSADIAAAVVEVKAELEKLREQVQNVE